MAKEEELKKWHSKWIAECKCDLRATAKQAVPGVGNPDADIVMIGEAPGRSEDEEGEPFVGAAGKFLNEMLGEISLRREDIYITNIVKYRPPNNRDPEPAEKEACRPWLEGELRIIEPKLIIFLGRHAMNNYFPELKIGNAHGKLLIKKIEGLSTRYFLPLYHPAAALYDGSMRQMLMDDFKKIPKILNEIAARESAPEKDNVPAKAKSEKKPQNPQKPMF